MSWSANMSSGSSAAFGAFGATFGIMGGYYSNQINELQTNATVDITQMKENGRRYGIALNKQGHFEAMAMQREGMEKIAETKEATIKSRVKTAEYHKQIKILTAQVLKAKQRENYPTPTRIG